MARKRKAALPSKVGTLGKAASTTATNNTLPPVARQFYKLFVVAMAVRGIISAELAQTFLERGGVLHD